MSGVARNVSGGGPARLARAMLVAVAWIFTPATGASAQQVAPRTGCTLSPGEYERDGYVLRRVNIRNVFDVVRRITPAVDPSAVQMPQAGAPFRVQAATETARSLVDFLRGRPTENDSPFVVTIVFDFIENCTDADGQRQLDLVFRTMTNRLPLTGGLTLESRQAQADDTPASVGAVRTSPPVRLVPRIGYNLADRAQIGGQLTMHPKSGFVHSASIDGFGSSTSRLIRGSLSGTTDSPGPFRRTEWRVSWSDAESPTAEQRLKERRLLAQAVTESQPLGRVGAILRFGASLEGGTQSIDLTTPAPDTTLLAQTGYGALRSYLGTGLNTEHQQLSGSYGLLLGRVPNGGIVDYRKHIVDVAYGVRKNVADHRALALESRITAGWLQVPRLAPASERFFGGNVPHDFIESDAWNIRANPLIRSFPDNYLGSSADGSAAGSSNFLALNLTGSIPVWRIPLVPSEISTLKEFTDAIEETKGTARQQLSSYYRAQDPAQRKVENDAAAVSGSLESLVKHGADIQPTAPEALRQRIKDCADAADEAKDRMSHLGNTGYGPIVTLIVPDVLEACSGDFNGDRVIASELERLRLLAARMSPVLTEIDEAHIKARVADDLGFAFRAFDTFVQDVNAVSVGPVIFFDAARLGPRSDVLSDRVRYAIGGGIRISVMNVMNITAGYAWNPSRRGSEKPGAFAVSLEIIDLFR